MSVVTVDPRYPIGKYEPQPFSIERKVEWLADIKFLPLQLESAILESRRRRSYRLPIVRAAGPYTNSCIILRTVILMLIAGSNWL